MGCDIHAFGEVLKDGKWVSADIWQKNPAYSEEELSVPNWCRLTDNRHYDLFAVLANVRNGTWSEKLPVIAEPRGLPEDASKEVLAQSERWNGDGHSHSFLTRAELQEGFNKISKHRVKRIATVGWSDEASPEVREWLAKSEETRGNPPSGYAAGSYGPRGEAPKSAWFETVEDMVGESVRSITSKLRDMEWWYDAEESRIVFWFDN